MTSATHVLSAFLFNALWQLPLVLAATLLAARLLRPLGAAALHRLWLGSLLLQCALPALSLLPLPHSSALHSAAHSHISVVFGPPTLPASTFPPFLLPAVIGVWAAVTLVFALRLVFGLRSLARLRHLSQPAPLSPAAAVAWRRLTSSLPSPPALALTTHTASPLTLGFRQPLVLLPAAFFYLPEPDLHTVLAHECAHIRRHDFASNLLLQILSLPLSFHPALSLTRARLLETREWVCDAEAARSIAGPRTYAATLLRLAGIALSPSRPPAPAVGLFTSSTLERRIMQLTRQHTPCSRPRRIANLVAAAALALGTAATALALGSTPTDATTSTNASTAAPRHVDSSIMAGNVLTKVNPVYPEAAKQAKIEGAVRLQATISATGTIQHLRVLSGPPELTKSATDAVRQWTYKPYRLNGDPLPVQTTITVNYSLVP